MTNKLTFVRKLTCLITAGVVLGGTCLAGDNAEVKNLVDSKYYNALISKGIVAQYRDDGSKGFKLLPESVYSTKINESQIAK